MTSRAKSALKHFFPQTVNRLKTVVRRFSRYDVAGTGDYPVAYQTGRDTGLRLNLVVPVISQKNAFGGVATAVRFFEQVRLSFPHARIIVTQEYAFEFEPNHWPGWVASDGQGDTNHPLEITFLAGRVKPLTIGTEDLFIATHWTTAFVVKRWLTGFAPTPTTGQRPFLYFIQDFEPGFYPWSSEYLLADSTYRTPQQVLAVFNTKLLCDYFGMRGYYFAEQEYFQPKLNPKLAKVLGNRKDIVKQKLILVYGRPTSPRNAFSLLLAGLRLWTRNDPNAVYWKVLSLGEIHPPFDLGHSVKLVSAGKLTLEQYAQTLLDAAIGCSLMVSPHPSYPPLEMAAFGAMVITNNFENKNLSQQCANIASLPEVSPESLAKALADHCARFVEGASVMLPNMDGLLSESGQDEFPFADSLVQRWLAHSPNYKP